MSEPFFLTANASTFIDLRSIASRRRVGKTILKRIVSMLTRLSQGTQTVSNGSNEYEYEYREAEYE
jgi:hypothetical protein